MKAIYILLIANVSFVTQAYAQDSSAVRTSMALNLGYNYTIQKDLYRSPYKYMGFNPLTTILAERESKQAIHRGYVGFMFGTSKTNFSPLASNNLLNVQYSYLRKIGSGKKFSVHMGPQLSGMGWSINYFPDMQAPSYSQVRSYMVGFSVGLGLNVRYTINSKSRFNLSLSAPVCTYAERPHFLDGSPRQAAFGAFNFWNPKVQLTYEYDLSPKVSFLIRYQYSYMVYSEPKPIRMMENGLSFGLRIRKIGKK